MTPHQPFLLASGILTLAHYASGLNIQSPIVSLIILIGGVSLIVMAIPKPHNKLLLGTGAMVVAHYASGMNIDNPIAEFVVLVIGCAMIMFGVSAGPERTQESGNPRHHVE